MKSLVVDYFKKPERFKFREMTLNSGNYGMWMNPLDVLYKEKAKVESKKLQIKPIGENWAAFYTWKFINQGITHFSIHLDFEEKTSDMVPYKYYIIELSLYDNRAIWFRKPTRENSKLIEEIIVPVAQIEDNFFKYSIDQDNLILWQSEEYRSWQKSKLFDFLLHPSIFPEVIPIDQIILVIEASLIFFDESNELLEKSCDYYPYELLDFLYFSLVTITTLGYGDIFPNTMEIRELVMAETLAGILIIGGIVSFLFSGARRNN